MFGDTMKPRLCSGSELRDHWQSIMLVSNPFVAGEAGTPDNVRLLVLTTLL